MEDKLNLTKEDILDKVFSKSSSGYNAFEVDQYLDMIIKDYDTYNRIISDLISKLNSVQNTQVMDKKTIQDLELMKSRLESKLSTLQNTNGVTVDNVSLLKRIDSLEKALFAMNVDPSKIN